MPALSILPRRPLLILLLEQFPCPPAKKATKGKARQRTWATHRGRAKKGYEKKQRKSFGQRHHQTTNNFEIRKSLLYGERKRACLRGYQQTNKINAQKLEMACPHAYMRSSVTERAECLAADIRSGVNLHVYLPTAGTAVVGNIRLKRRSL